MKLTIRTIAMIVLMAMSNNARPMPTSPAVFPASKFSFDKSLAGSIYGTPDQPDKITFAFIQEKLGLSAEDVVIKNIVPSVAAQVTSVYLTQKVNGIEVTNAVMNINIDKEGHVISYGENIFHGTHPSPPTFSQSSASTPLSRSPAEAFKTLTDFLNIVDNGSPLNIEQKENSIADAAHNNRPVYVISKPGKAEADVPVRLSYVQTNDGSRIELAYSFQLQLKDNWYEAHVGIDSGKVIAANDWVSDATYNVLDINMANPIVDSRTIITPAVNNIGSSFDWHSNGKISYTDTRGNAVWAQENSRQVTNIAKLYRPNGGSALTFDFPLYLDKDPSFSKNAAITELFYLNNMLHDTLYSYGFDEASGNFQDNNNNKGGKGSDYVIANAEVLTGTNNANFATPPDGYKGTMNMYLWTLTNPKRDGIFDVGIVIHEYGHGLSNRLTGGPANSNCLSNLQSGGMGEGWSDVLAIVFSQKASNQRTDQFLMGSYATGGTGVRKYPYSTNMAVNPLLYSYISRSDYAQVHAIGTVWATILLEVYWNLVDNIGFTSDLNSASLSKGNTLFLSIMITGMKLQPCNPTFITARDAFIQAEMLLTNGNYKCQVWQGFSKRGLGYDAKFVNSLATDGFQLPPGC